MAEATSKERFEAAVNVIKGLPKNGPFQPSNEILLKFYAYYKQATTGRCNIPKPWAWEVVNKAKWDAWNSVGDMTQEEARTNYVNELKKIVETMPQTESVSEFMDKLGQFYEVVDDHKEFHPNAVSEESKLLENGDLESSMDVSLDLDLHMNVRKKHNDHDYSQSNDERGQNLGEMFLSDGIIGDVADSSGQAPDDIVYRNAVAGAELPCFLSNGAGGHGENEEEGGDFGGSQRGDLVDTHARTNGESFASRERQMGGDIIPDEATPGDPNDGTHTWRVNEGYTNPGEELSGSDADEFCDTSDDLVQIENGEGRIENNTVDSTSSQSMRGSSQTDVSNTISTTALIHCHEDEVRRVTGHGQLASAIDNGGAVNSRRDLCARREYWDNGVDSSAGTARGRGDKHPGVSNGQPGMKPSCLRSGAVPRDLVRDRCDGPQTPADLVDFSQNSLNVNAGYPEFAACVDQVVSASSIDHETAVMVAGQVTTPRAWVYASRQARGGETGGDDDEDHRHREHPRRDKPTPAATWAGGSGSARRRGPLQQGGAGGQDGDELTSHSYSVNQQISVTLSRLEQDLNGIVMRLDSLERLTRQRNASGERGRNQVQTVQNWMPPWLLRWLPSTSRTNLFFMFVWPFMVHWFMIYWLRRRHRPRS